MAAKQGRLFVKKGDEGGADATYDGATVSDFAKAASNAKPSSNFAAAKPRFDEPQQSTPEYEVAARGIADSAHGKGVPSWTAQKPRFADAQDTGVGAGDYSAPVSDFEKAVSNAKPSPMMMTPEKQKTRGGWMEQPEQVASPPPADLPGAFNIKNKPSPFSSAGAPRFKETESATHGEPSIDSSLTSDFAKAAAKSKPSPNAMASSTRFKNDVVSYGDPGANASSADLERQQLEARMARQKHQAESTAQRDMNKYQ
jgi:hypothetical protein